MTSKISYRNLRKNLMIKLQKIKLKNYNRMGFVILYGLFHEFLSFITEYTIQQH
jgi:hypothetical protein